ncbi:MAG TPA: LPO_1073/Vpar_1526 family protein [Burkholderiaceae bacterium]
MPERQSQSVAESSTAYQAGRDVVLIQGVSASEARQIAHDLFRANLMEFKAEAAEVARQRCEEVTTAFLEKLQTENPEGLNQAREPDFQDALFSVQKEHAKAGDKELSDLLVDLLVDRTKERSRTILQLVLNEALRTAPKLTSAQTATLAVVFFFRNVRRMNGIPHIAELGAHFQRSMEQAAAGFSNSASTFNHLAFTGCTTDSLAASSLPDVLSRTYPGLFTIGFEQAALEQAQLSDAGKAMLIIPCMDDPTRFQVNALNDEDFDAKCAAVGLSQEEKVRATALFKSYSMPHDKVQSKMVEAAPFMSDIFAAWSAADAKHHALGRYQLTSVGMAIGHASIKRYIGEFAPLDIWIN